MSELQQYPIERRKNGGFDERLCKQNKENCERRFTGLEECIHDINIKLEQFGQRLPTWAVLVLSGLSTACGSLVMWIITRGH